MMMKYKSVKDIRDRLKVAPDDAEARWRHGCALAFSGNWEDAWPEMEWRFKGHNGMIAQRKEFPKPDWDGSHTNLLVYQDQGYGDLFQYVRYLHELHCPYVFQVPPEVYTLMKYQGFNVVIRGTPLPAYDQVVAICSLPHYFRKFSATHDYLTAPKSGRFTLEGGKKKIGIAWAGNPDFFDDGHRSCDPQEFMELTDCGELISLMIRKVDLPFTDFSMRLRDFSDTAELIDQLDCVVTVDTAVAHLAAAMGKPVYLALSYEHDWRWMADKTDTPWYPTMKLFRQPVKDDWDSVFNQIKKMLL